MNAIELYKLWGVFNQMIEDPHFDTQAKLSMGREMISSLPPEMLCSVSKSSLTCITAAMQGRLSNMEENNGSIQAPKSGNNRSKGTTRRGSAT